MINVLFFARVRELTGCDGLQLNEAFATVETLRQQLVQRGERWSLALNKESLLVAVNQTLVPLTQPLTDGDEVAFFPPVTGG